MVRTLLDGQTTKRKKKLYAKKKISVARHKHKNKESRGAARQTGLRSLKNH